MRRERRDTAKESEGAEVKESWKGENVRKRSCAKDGKKKTRKRKKEPENEDKKKRRRKERQERGRQKQ